MAGRVPASWKPPHPYSLRWPRTSASARAPANGAIVNAWPPCAAQDAEREFIADLASGTLPSLRSIRTRMHVGQDRARAIREHLESVAVRAEFAL